MGSLPQYCVNCPDNPTAIDCESQRSCMWHNWTGSNFTDGNCSFNPEVTPQMGIGGSMGVNQTAQGVLAGAFMGGYCVFSPVFAYLASTDMAPFSLVGTGLSVWLVAALLGAFSPHYGGLLAARVLSGVGEASFQCIAPCFLDDVAPAEQKGCCTPAEQKGCCTPATTFLLLPHENSISVGSRQFLAAAACPPAAASTLIHSVQLVRRDGRDVSTLYGREGGGRPGPGRLTRIAGPVLRAALR